MLRGRLISTAILVSILSTLVWADLTLGSSERLGRPGLFLAPMAIAAIILGGMELADLFRSGGYPATNLSCVLGALLTMLGALAPILWRDYPVDCAVGKNGWTVFGAAAGVGVILLIEMVRFRQPGQAVIRAALAIFVLGYLGILMSYFAALRFFHDNAWGMVALISTIAIVKVSDSGAYLIGKSLGRHKLAPVLSPGKTWEGMVGALLGGLLASWLSFSVLAPWIVGGEISPPSWWAVVLYGLIVTIAGMLGDLAESLIKRDMNRKDASKLMPGLGGVLDVVDSILAAAPAAYACWVAGLVGPAAV